MNRRERRAARKGEVIFVDNGRLDQRHPNYGLPVSCYLCGAAHKAFGFARIRDQQSTTDVALCDACFAGDKDDKGQALLRKYLNAPNLEVREGGIATTEQIIAMADKPDKPEH